MTKQIKKSLLIGFMFLVIVGCMFAMLIPPAYAETYNTNYGTTNVNISVDDQQLSFTAPTSIDFSMGADGTFTTPSNEVAYIKNNSVMPIRVSSYDVYNDATEATGFETVDCSEAKSVVNAYQIDIATNGQSDYISFAKSKNFSDDSLKTIAKE